MRVGVVSDTHVPEAGEELPRQLFAAFRDCELILHCGDMHSIGVIDWLESLAPALAARGNGDTHAPAGIRPGVPEDPRVAEAHVLEIEGFVVGVTHDLELAESAPDDHAERLVHEAFGRPVDIALGGHTHVPSARSLESGRVLLNPGSPTMPYGYLNILGTVALLDVRDGAFEFSVVELESGGVVAAFVWPGDPVRWRGPRPARRQPSKPTYETTSPLARRVDFTRFAANSSSG